MLTTAIITVALAIATTAGAVWPDDYLPVVTLSPEEGSVHRVNERVAVEIATSPGATCFMTVETAALGKRPHTWIVGPDKTASADGRLVWFSTVGRPADAWIDVSCSLDGKHAKASWGYAVR